MAAKKRSGKKSGKKKGAKKSAEKFKLAKAGPPVKVSGMNKGLAAAHAANRKKNKGKKRKPQGPTAFQRFLMREGTGAMKKVPAWRKAA